jgi:2-polyprenyl-3-methyl-5-hydroxy-6-metoxy-1,4-benzoquinol methylase
VSSSVPIALFVFNRNKDLQRTLDCLRNSGVQELYVFADGPRNAQEKVLTDLVRKTIDRIDWAKTKKYYQTDNLGLSESIKHGLDTVFKTHDSAVVIEDDICVAPNFYKYAVECLEAYSDREDILGITGLKYPFERGNLDSSEADVFMAPRFSSWGWATWRHKWQLVDFNLGNLEAKLQKSKNTNLGIAGSDAAYSIELLLTGRLSGCWDVYVLINMIIRGQYFVWPTNNMVKNTGLLEGTHAGGKAPSWTLEWEEPDKKEFFLPPKLQKNDKIVDDFVEFFNDGNQRLEGINMVRKIAKKLMYKAGYNLSRVPKAVGNNNTDPSEYSTTDEPMEVPCQKESYFIALNKYIKDGDRVLDVGMGVGYGMNLLSIKANEVYAVDVDDKAVKFCSENNLGKNPKIKELKKYDGYKLPYKDSFFDVVTCVDVIEHVEDYDKFIDELMRVAKRAVIFATPNKRPEYTNPDGSPMNHWHLREWSFDEFDKIIKAHATKIEWNVLDGPWEGPFKHGEKANMDTLVLLPALIIGRS